MLSVDGHWLECGRDPDVALDMHSGKGNKVCDADLRSICDLIILYLTLIMCKSLNKYCAVRIKINQRSTLASKSMKSIWKSDKNIYR